MADVELVDQSLRDGQQSLWGMRMRAGHILPIAAEIDSVGYRIVDLTGSSMFEVLVRHCREDPWEGLDRIRAAMPRSTLRAAVRSNGVVGMGLAPNSILELWIQTLARHGIGSLWTFDCLLNLDQLEWMVRLGQECGLRVSPQIMFSNSPVHTDEYFLERLRIIASWQGLDSVMLGDEAGSLTADRAAQWIPAMLTATGDLPVELHFHNTTGVGAQNYLIGVAAGARIVHTATSPMANGPSLPSVETTVDNLLRLGHRVPIDTEPLPRIAEHFTRAAYAAGFPPGSPAEYRVAVYQQQLPGGMMGTLANQLATYGLQDRLPELLDEVATVRREMGYPVMATPFSQLVGAQALLNIMGPYRYANIPDENLHYLAGHYGPHPGTVAPEVLDLAFGNKRGRAFQQWEQPQPSLAEIRQAHGIHLTDEELLLRYLIPVEDVAAMRAAGPLEENLVPPGTSPAGMWARDLISSSVGRTLSVDAAGLSIRLSQ
jgi:oxaloacetate decarboxylase alpha subunit